MNRAERRRNEREVAARLNTGEDLGWTCSWNGCPNAYKGDKPLGWRNLVVIKKSLLHWDGFGSDRDGVLCPDHVKELEGLLKPLNADNTGEVVPLPNYDGTATYMPQHLWEKS